MNILVVGRGDCEKIEVANGHVLEFLSSAKAGDGLIALTGFDFVFQHLSPANPEARDAIHSWTQKGWRGKVLGFSGGDRLSERYSDLTVPVLVGLPDRPSILGLAWESVPAPYPGTAEELAQLLPHKAMELIPSLVVLCQGFLTVAAMAKERNDRTPEHQRALDLMGWKEELRKIPMPTFPTVASSKWWAQALEFDALAEPERKGYYDRLLSRLASEWNPKPFDASCISKTIKKIRDGDELDIELVAQCYLTIAERLHPLRRRVDIETSLIGNYNLGERRSVP